MQRSSPPKRVYVPLVARSQLGVVVILTSGTAASWIKWNYTGYEGKSTYSQYQQINNFIASLPPGRVMVEHSATINDFGTERAFELIPYWTELDAENGNGIAQPTMEGTLMEASFTAPFHFINQAELSEEPSDAISGISYPPLDIPNGLTHLQLMNIPYLLTVSSQVTSAVKADPRATLLGYLRRLQRLPHRRGHRLRAGDAERARPPERIRRRTGGTSP